MTDFEVPADIGVVGVGPAVAYLMRGSAVGSGNYRITSVDLDTLAEREVFPLRNPPTGFIDVASGVLAALPAGPNGTITARALRGDAVVGSVPLGHRAISLRLSPDAHRVAAVHWSADGQPTSLVVSVFDVATGTLLRTEVLDQAGPGALVYEGLAWTGTDAVSVAWAQLPATAGLYDLAEVLKVRTITI